jgi:hypothetical protein
MIKNHINETRGKTLDSNEEIELIPLTLQSINNSNPLNHLINPENLKDIETYQRKL